jgi:hypothetical protein
MISAYFAVKPVPTTAMVAAAFLRFCGPVGFASGITLVISLIVCDDVAWLVMLTIFDVDSDTSFVLGHALSLALAHV